MLQWMAWKGEDTMMFIKFLEDGDSRNKRLTVSALEFVNHLLTPDYADIFQLLMLMLMLLILLLLS